MAVACRADAGGCAVGGAFAGFCPGIVLELIDVVGGIADGGVIADRLGMALNAADIGADDSSLITMGAMLAGSNRTGTGSVAAMAAAAVHGCITPGDRPGHAVTVAVTVVGRTGGKAVARQVGRLAVIAAVSGAHGDVDVAVGMLQVIIFSGPAVTVTTGEAITVAGCVFRMAAGGHRAAVTTVAGKETPSPGCWLVDHRVGADAVDVLNRRMAGNVVAASISSGCCQVSSGERVERFIGSGSSQVGQVPFYPAVYHVRRSVVVVTFGAEVLMLADMTLVGTGGDVAHDYRCRRIG